MTDQDNEDFAFTEKVDPFQARNGRREALQFAMGLINREFEDAGDLVRYANVIDTYLEDGTLPAE